MTDPVLELPCGCELPAQYLPLSGGERRHECPRTPHIYIIEGVRKTLTEFKVREVKR